MCIFIKGDMQPSLCAELTERSVFHFTDGRAGIHGSVPTPVVPILLFLYSCSVCESAQDLTEQEHGGHECPKRWVVCFASVAAISCTVCIQYYTLTFPCPP